MSGIIEQAPETFQRIMCSNSYCEIVDKYLYSPHTFGNTMNDCTLTRGHCATSPEASLPLTCHVHSLHLNTCRGRNGGKLQSLWRCLIQTTLLVYLYAVQLGFLQGMHDKNIAQVCKSPQCIWFIINWGSFQSIPKHSEQHFWCCWYLWSHKNHIQHLLNCSPAQVNCKKTHKTQCFNPMDSLLPLF